MSTDRVSDYQRVKAEINLNESDEEGPAESTLEIDIKDVNK